MISKDLFKYMYKTQILNTELFVITIKEFTQNEINFQNMNSCHEQNSFFQCTSINVCFVFFVPNVHQITTLPQVVHGKKSWMTLTKAALTKGQLISKCPFGVFKSPQKPTKFL